VPAVLLSGVLLADYAFYSSVGYQTAVSMGQARVHASR
jgi:hypothetical protein